MFPKLDVQIGTICVDQNIKDAIHGVAVHLHQWSGKSPALSDIHQAMHNTNPPPQRRQPAPHRRAPVDTGEMNGADAALCKKTDQFAQDQFTLSDRDVLEDNVGMNQVKTLRRKRVQIVDVQQTRPNQRLVSCNSPAPPPACSKRRRHQQPVANGPRTPQPVCPRRSRSPALDWVENRAAYAFE